MKNLFICASIAVLYTIPFYNPSYWPLLFMCMPIALYYALPKPLTFLQWLVWSSTHYSLLLLGLFEGLYTMACGPWYIKLAPILLMLSYVSILSAAWLWLLRFLPRNILIWTLHIWLYYLFITQWILIPVGLQGIIFANPFIALPPSMIFMLQKIGTPLSLLIFCIVSSSIMLCFKHLLFNNVDFLSDKTMWRYPRLYTDYYYKNRHNNPSTKEGFFYLLFACLLPFIVIQPPQKQRPPAWLNDIEPLSLMIPKQPLSNMQKTLTTYLQNTSKSIVIMPESAWQEDALALPKRPDHIKHLILGSFTHKNNCRLNTLSYIHQNKLKTFHKRQVLPLAEQSYCSLVDSCFFTKTPETIPSSNQRSLWKLNNDCHLVPYICSELFCNTMPDDAYPDTTILVCCNDWWFTMPYFQRLLIRAARIQAVAWSRPVLFISYRSAAYFDRFGNKTLLPTIEN